MVASEGCVVVAVGEPRSYLTHGARLINNLRAMRQAIRDPLLQLPHHCPGFSSLSIQRCWPGTYLALTYPVSPKAKRTPCPRTGGWAPTTHRRIEVDSSQLQLFCSGPGLITPCLRKRRVIPSLLHLFIIRTGATVPHERDLDVTAHLRLSTVLAIPWKADLAESRRDSAFRRSVAGPVPASTATDTVSLPQRPRHGDAGAAFPAEGARIQSQRSVLQRQRDGHGAAAIGQHEGDGHLEGLAHVVPGHPGLAAHAGR